MQEWQLQDLIVHQNVWPQGCLTWELAGNARKRITTLAEQKSYENWVTPITLLHKVQYLLWLCVCPSISHKPVLCQNGWIGLSSLFAQRLPSPYCTVSWKDLGYLQNKGIFLHNFIVQTLCPCGTLTIESDTNLHRPAIICDLLLWAASTFVYNKADMTQHIMWVCLRQLILVFLLCLFQFKTTWILSVSTSVVPEDFVPYCLLLLCRFSFCSTKPRLGWEERFKMSYYVSGGL